jgi:hypothetical protein
MTRHGGQSPVRIWRRQKRIIRNVDFCCAQRMLSGRDMNVIGGCDVSAEDPSVCLQAGTACKRAAVANAESKRKSLPCPGPL